MQREVLTNTLLMEPVSNLSLDTVITLKSIASDAFKRGHLIQDQTCIGGLVLILSNPDSTLVKEALHTLILLADTSERKKKLKNSIGLIKSLETLITSRNADSEVIRLSEQLYDLLTEEDPVPFRDTSNSLNVSKTHQKPRGSASLFGTAAEKTKLIYLQIRGLIDTEDKEVCRTLLLQVKGVISITFDSNRKRCICRTRRDVPPKRLAAAIAKSQTMSADQIIRDETGQEVSMSLLSSDGTDGGPDLPDYPPADSPDRSQHPVARVGAEHSNSGWFSSVANFVTNSFYW